MSRQTCWTKFRDKKAERPLVGGDLSLTTQSILVAWSWWWVRLRTFQSSHVDWTCTICVELFEAEIMIINSDK